MSLTPALHRRAPLCGLAVMTLTAATNAQPFDLSWFTIDGGGGTSTGDGFILSGTLGQFDAGTLGGAGLLCDGGFWSVGISVCYANCDSSSIAPILNVNDFQCFLNKFAAADPYANCDNSSIPPVLNVNDFQCFLNKFAAGCT